MRYVSWGVGSRAERVVVRAGRPIRLVFERLDVPALHDCVTIPSLGWVTTLGSAARSSVDLGPCPVGAHAFSSGDGSLRGCLVVKP